MERFKRRFYIFTGILTIAIMLSFTIQNLPFSKDVIGFLNALLLVVYIIVLFSDRIMDAIDRFFNG